MKNRNAERSANIPPLFIADSKGNLTAWVEKCFPQNPTISPQEAIRLWLADGNTGRNTRPETSLRHTFSSQAQPQNGHRSKWNRDDERFAATLRAVAEMVTAALDNDHNDHGNGHQRNAGEDTSIRHPIHSAGARSPDHFSEIDQSAHNWPVDPMETYPAAVHATWSAPRTEEYSANGAGAGRDKETRTHEETWTKDTAFLQNQAPSNGHSGHYYGVVKDGKVNGEDEITPNAEGTGHNTSGVAAQYHQSHSNDETTPVTSLGLHVTWVLLTAASIVFLILFLGSLFYRHRVNAQIPSPTASSPEALKNSVAERASPPVRAPLPAASVGSITPGVASVRNVLVVRERDGIAVEVLTDGEAVPKLTKLSGPDRIVLDFLQTQIATSSRRIPVNIASVKAVRMAMNGLTPPTTRVVVDLLEPCEYTMAKSSNRLTLHLRRVMQ